MPDKDYQAITQAKERRSGRVLEGYTWQEERQMMISEKFAGNEGTMGGVGGAVGGFMMGGALGGTISDIARSALSEDRIPNSAPPKDLRGNPSGAFDVGRFFEDDKSSQSTAPDVFSPSQVTQPTNTKSCAKCEAYLPEGAAFCPKCGGKVDSGCPNCGTQLPQGAAFCHKCGRSLQ